MKRIGGSAKPTGCAATHRPRTGAAKPRCLLRGEANLTFIRVKICGLSTETTLDAALRAGADLVGFVRFAKSPRHLTLDRARDLSLRAKGRTERVVLLVDPDDAQLDAAVAAIEPDVIQLHGQESPERVAAIRLRSGRPVMKAVGIASRDDLETIAAYAIIADRLLLDAKPAPAAVLPGGNGLAFDWSLLDGTDLPPGTMLSGGLTADTVAAALARTGLTAIDVSSGVETAPGEKSAEKIEAFVAAARAQ